ncbi:hypothetical protein GI584_21140 [Gracilibacillus salitolerans]|uniref:NERD domain-containing protein n=1 Tax=Gracilibacillus salitolerans TaxID=2663022 RepID=A0A5Q2TNU4_9BACI|nr:hypothetical protein GI584_21140 [Gracilibacillus salitolerans]
MIPQTPILSQQYRALLELLPEQHLEYPNIINHFRRQDAGQAGEDSLTFFLDQAQVPSLTCIKRLRLEHHSSFQLDWLVLGLGFRIIFEVKSHTGEIYFDAKSHQLTRIIDCIKEGFDESIANMLIYDPFSPLTTSSNYLLIASLSLSILTLSSAYMITQNINVY